MRGKKQPNWQKWMNKVAASVRSGIERTNATLKNWYGMARVRYLGMARNHCHLQLVACALNAKRALVQGQSGLRARCVQEAKIGANEPKVNSA